MRSRITTTAILRGLFQNLAESGLTDDEITCAFDSSVPAKTLWRLRNNAPETITLPQLQLLVRLISKTTGIDSAKLFHHVRHPAVPVDTRLKAVAFAQVFGHSPKSHAAVKMMCDELANTARHIRLFDRDSSFSYLLPTDDESSIHEFKAQSTNHKCVVPQISITITLSSLFMRKQKLGDEAIECLIDHVERDAHLIIIDDSKRNAGRTRRGIFTDAKALAIIDSRAMFVLPDHGRAVRCYRADQSSVHSEIVQSGIDQLERIGQFRMQLPDRADMIAFLKSHLSYRLPYSSEKFTLSGSSNGRSSI